MSTPAPTVPGYRGRDLPTVRNQAWPNCRLCGRPGVLFYRDVPDYRGSLGGTWSHRRCATPGCGLVWMDPVPVEEDMGEAYREYYTHQGQTASYPVLSALRAAYLRHRMGYAAPPSDGNVPLALPLVLLATRLVPGFQDAIQDTACHLPAPAPGARILEVGFGSADQMARMEALGWDVTGVDPDPISVEAARERGLVAHQGDLAEQHFPDASFDAIYLSHVIEHVYEPVDLLRECRRVLKPGGTVVVVTPNVAGLGQRLLRRDWINLDPPRHLVLFDRRTLRRTAEESGLEVRSLRTSVRIAFMIKSAAANLRARRPFDAPPTRSGLLGAVAFQYFEGLVRLLWPEAGEELVLLATRLANA